MAERIKEQDWHGRHVKGTGGNLLEAREKFALGLIPQPVLIQFHVSFSFTTNELASMTENTENSLWYDITPTEK